MINATVLTYGGVLEQFTMQAGDVGWAPIGLAHSQLCVSVEPCELLLVWDAGEVGTLELSTWMRNSPPSVVASNLNITEQQFSAFQLSYSPFSRVI